VVVTGVEDGLVPHAGSVSPEQVAEEARLLYVAVTRASDDLTVTAAGRRKGNDVAESPWLPVMRAALPPTRTPVAPPRALTRRERPADPLDGLRAWRAGVARAAGVVDSAVCSDQMLRSLLADPPADVDALAQRLGVGRSAAARFAPRVLELLGTQSPA